MAIQGFQNFKGKAASRVSKTDEERGKDKLVQIWRELMCGH
jgi:hypothetical protein